jgi:RimJ/RimL family protein N-acetyltransferase
VGFKGAPDETGTTEIGYGIDPAYRNAGYMTEAVKGLIGWAFQQSGCKTVVARDTKKVNAASRRVLEKAGMAVYNETEDAFDWKVDQVGWESVA